MAKVVALGYIAKCQLKLPLFMALKTLGLGDDFAGCTVSKLSASSRL
jgi:hypothetical protein